MPCRQPRVSLELDVSSSFLPLVHTENARRTFCRVSGIRALNLLSTTTLKVAPSSAALSFTTSMNVPRIISSPTRHRIVMTTMSLLLKLVSWSRTWQLPSGSVTATPGILCCRPCLSSSAVHEEGMQSPTETISWLSTVCPDTWMMGGRIGSMPTPVL